MHGVSRKMAAALGALLVAAIAAGAILLLSRDDSSPDKPNAATAAQAEPRAIEEAKAQERRGERRRLVISDRGHPIVWVRHGHTVDIRSSPGGPVFAVERTDGRWAGVPNAFTGNGTLGWVRLDARQLRAGYTTRSILVDLSDFRAQLMKGDRVVRSFTVAIGAPGTDTPTGRYAVTDTFRGDLNPAYGCCAVALSAVQPNLDSGWIGGDRIAFHGTAGPLGVAISHGCIRAADRDVSALVNQVPPGTPVTVRQ
jgi:hypothetical protein